MHAYTCAQVEFNRLSGTIPLELAGRCSAAHAYGHSYDHAEGHSYGHSHAGALGSGADTDWEVLVSDPTDGPRSLHHPLLPAHQRRTSALLRLRGNPGLVTDISGVPVDIADLSTHDLCAFAAGPTLVQLGADSPADSPADSQQTREIRGTIFRSPSARAEGAAAGTQPED